MVILSARPHPALRRYRWYDDRSLIENGVFRDAKQHFALGSSLARHRPALETAVVFSLVVLMLDRGLRTYTEKLIERADRRAEQLAVLRYRRQLEHRDGGWTSWGGGYGSNPEIQWGCGVALATRT